MIRIFIGADDQAETARKVLEHSIRARTVQPVEITTMQGPEWAYDRTGITVGTAFSLCRWLIPSRCGYEGRAIYLDADQLVLADIGELWDLSNIGEAPAWTTFQPDSSSSKPVPQTSVMVLDCRRARPYAAFDPERMLKLLREKPERYAQFMHAENLFPGQLPGYWNHLDYYVAKGVDRTRLLHYTSMGRQPWRTHRYPHPRSGAEDRRLLWERELSAAVKAGAISLDEVRAAVAKWRPEKGRWRNPGLHPHYLAAVTAALRKR